MHTSIFYRSFKHRKRRKIVTYELMDNSNVLGSTENDNQSIRFHYCWNVGQNVILHFKNEISYNIPVHVKPERN